MNWETKPLGEILSPSGRHRAGSQDLPVLSITMKHGLVDQAEKFKKRIASNNTENYRIAYRNELVVGFPIDEGVIGFQTKYPAGIVSPAYDIWKLTNEDISHIPYLERYLRSTQARNLYASRMQGAVARRRSLTKSDFEKLEIPFPPLNDQIRIAHLLGKVEGLIAQRKQHLQQLDDFLKSIFLEMFGDPVRNEKGWESFLFSNLFSSPPRIGTTKPVSPDGIIPVIRVGELGEFQVKFNNCKKVTLENAALDKCRVEEGDILLARAIASQSHLGKASLITKLEQDTAFDSHVMRIRFNYDQVNPVFAYHWLKSDGGRSRFLNAGGKTSVQFNINSKQISSINMPLPPHDLQIQFATIVEKVEALKSRYQQSLIDLESLYGALSQKAFKGDLDLSKVPLIHEAQTNTAEERFLTQQQEAVKDSSDNEYINIIKLINQVSITPPNGLIDNQGNADTWLDAYIQYAKVNKKPLDIKLFLQVCSEKWNEQYQFSGGGIVENLYDKIKDKIFEKLSNSELIQEHDEENIAITLRLATQGT
jgi:type I restriction enzyme, S subunit